MENLTIGTLARAAGVVVIEEVPLANWGVGGLPVELYREAGRVLTEG